MRTLVGRGLCGGVEVPDAVAAGGGGGGAGAAGVGEAGADGGVDLAAGDGRGGVRGRRYEQRRNEGKDEHLSARHL